MWSRFATLAAVVISMSILNAAQEPQQPPAFRGGVNLIQLDVSVLDDSGRPLRGLSASDFEVLENGRPQRIVAFTPVEVPEAVVPSAAWAHDIPEEVATNQGSTHRVFLILMDDATIPFEAQMMATAKQVARAVVEGMGPGDLAAVVFTADNRNALDFTSDRQRLLTAIETFRAGWHSHSYQGVVNPDGYFQHLPPDALNRAVEYLSEITERRKALVFISSGSSTPASFDLSVLFRRAQSANVSIFPVDPSGFGLEDFVRGRLALRGVAGPQANEMARVTALRRQERLLEIARNTGGHAVMKTNDFEAGVREILSQTSAFYLIGYESSHSQERSRRIDVRVKRAGAQLRSRRGSWTPPTDGSREALRPEEAAIASLLPKADLPLRMHVAPLITADHASGAVVTVGIDEREASLPTSALNVIVGAYDPEGRPRGVWRQRFDGINTTGREVSLVVQLKPGRYAIRAGVHLEATEQSGSVYADAVVPEFLKDRLTLSGVMISASGRGQTHAHALKGLVTVVPSTRRHFDRSEQVTGFVRVYYGARDAGVPVDVTVSIVDARNQSVFESKSVIGAPLTASTASADHAFEVPVAELTPGQYLLSVSARAGDATVRRGVALTVGPINQP